MENFINYIYNDCYLHSDHCSGYLSELVDLSVFEVFECVGVTRLYFTKPHITNPEAHLSHIQQSWSQRRVHYEQILHQSFLTLTKLLPSTVLSPHAKRLPLPELPEDSNLKQKIKV